MSDLKQTRPAGDSKPWRRWLLAGAGLVVFHLCSVWAGEEEGLWLPGLGVGLALVAWLGHWMVPLLALDLFVGRCFFRTHDSIGRMLGDSALLAAEIGLSWWIYARLARGTRRLEDPRSATVFLILVPGALAAAFASVQALSWGLLDGIVQPFWPRVGTLWISRALGILALAPPLLVTLTPYLVRGQLTHPEPPAKLPGGNEPQDWTLGEIIETAGLCLGAGVLAAVLVMLQVRQERPTWTLWGFSLLLVVWAALRQGLRGGALTAATSALCALGTAAFLHVLPAQLSPMQGNLLAQCSTALLVGASAGWIRASETRYRQIVGHIPVVLYSARLPRGLSVPLQTTPAPANHAARRLDVKAETHVGPALVKQAEVILVSPACQAVFDRSPEEMLGPYAHWLDRIEPADRELLIAALTQLLLQDQPVTCEYRVLPMSDMEPATASATAAAIAAGLLSDGDQPPVPQNDVPKVRWVRDTLVAYHASPGTMDGWEGVIEDITEHRALAQNLRRSNGMLQAMVSYLPTGVFFVQGQKGLPILVNQRARQLLGQREDLAAGIAHLSKVYRLHRADGSEYPVDELPVAKALRLGTTCMANDVVVHRPDGRRIPLITWAAPVDLTGMGRPDAAVWVLEDLTALQQAESARRETEARLRGVIETMAEGVIVQNPAGVILESNPAASLILGIPHDQLVGRASLCPDGGLREDDTPFPRDEQPDLRALRSGTPVRNVIMGVPVGTPPAPPLRKGGNTDAAPLRNGGTTDAPQANGEPPSSPPHTKGATTESPPLTKGGPGGVDKAPQMRWIFVNAMPLPVGAAFAPNSKGARVVTTFADITAHRHALDELQRAQRLELVGRLASGTVHDFNNLLTVMIGLASLVESTLAADHPAQSDLHRLMEAGEQASHLAGQMLAFSKQKKPVLHGVDLNTVVVHSLRLLKGAMPPDIAMQHRLEGDVLLVKADEMQLRQVVMNLCLNARDAMNHGGKLTISTERAAGQNGDGKTWVKLAVQDTGQGMDEATQDRIFEPFFSTKERGTGLGLAVVKQIIESLGGRIQVSSRPGEGTRMEVFLRAHLE